MAEPAVADAIVAEPRVSFRRVLLLCLPALILGAILRIEFTLTTPEIFYGADSNSYFEAAVKLWTEGRVSFNAKRRYLYPAIMIVSPLLPGTPATSMTIVQHLLGLLTIVGVGWVVAQMTRFPTLFVPPATCLAAIWPRMIWYEHEMMAEAWLLAAFVGAVALALPCGVLKDKRRLFWFLLMLAAIVALKPHGRALWLGLMITALPLAGNPLKWGWKNLVMVGLSVLIMVSVGSSTQGNWLLLNTTFPFVKTEGEPYAQYRTILRPFVEEARADVENYAQHQVNYKKALMGMNTQFGGEWVALTKQPKLYAEIAKRFAQEAVIAYPVGYAILIARKIGNAGDADLVAMRTDPAVFWSRQAKADLKHLQKPPAELALLHEMDKPSYLRLVEERRTRTTWLAPVMVTLSEKLHWAYYEPRGPGQPPRITPTMLGWLMLLGVVVCVLPRHFMCRAVLWLPAAVYVIATFGVGDALPRYLHPVDWVGIVLIAIGLDMVAGLVKDGMARLRGTRRAAPLPAA
jgi:hypothetical protein